MEQFITATKFDPMISALYTTRQLHPAGANAKQCYRVYIPTRAAACGGRARLQGAAGLRYREAAARSVLTDRPTSSNSPEACPQPSG